MDAYSKICEAEKQKYLREKETVSRQSRSKALLAVCRLADAGCRRQTACPHFSPHTPDEHCGDADICYDHSPPERVWCELRQANDQANRLA